MKTRIFRIIRTTIFSRTFAVFGVFTAFLLSAGVAVAYGPERPTFTTQEAAPYITFNSITNDTEYGDERNFMLIKDASHSGKGGWKDNITVEDGKEYLVRILVHNNAKPQLNLVAKNTRVAVNVPRDFTKTKQLDGFIRADNADPKEIWDFAKMTADEQFYASYIPGSAHFLNTIKPNGFSLSDNIVTNGGAKVGYEQMDGNLPGCSEYAGYAVFGIKVTMSHPNFTMHKKVRLHGTEEWKDAINAKPGQKVDYQIYYANIGDAKQTNVAAIDELPAGVKYVNGSTTLRNASNPNGDGLKITSNDLTTKGINIGDYNPVSNAYVRFTATLPKKDEIETCGAVKLINTGVIVTENGERSDTATVTVNKTCAPGETPAPTGELPTTGPLEVIAGLAGVSAITIGVVYYFKSRRELDNVLLHAEGGKKGSVIDMSGHITHHHDNEHK